ncbi:metallophosphoesterase family protein [Hymenobacter jeollabukensis]|uniref:Metallophosphoesterase n=1 Tax=Hymenobacter jeollabukensis TaxID=2025313 RepID=A0A5R8WHX5_9BACT|nr:metallophosphoesterase [Hymenobacter jeollabukensis]TLM87950.1 metallophosphoesterase [Hymenobacter jeollabukensis]
MKLVTHRGVSAALLLLTTGCHLLEFSPSQVAATGGARQLTAQNLARLRQQPRAAGGDTVRFVFIGDTQRFYDETAEFVRSVNRQRGIDFVLIGGDISDFGLGREMQWMHARLRRLQMPYLTVIGNHDQVGNGRAAYQAVFGPLNYSFEYGGTRFVLIDTNGREVGCNGTVPDLGWLRRELADTTRRTVVACHVPPNDNDFDQQLTPAYAAALARHPRLVLHLAAHVHRYTAKHPFHDAVPYITTYSLQKHRYHIVSVWGRREFRLETVDYGPAS